MDFAKGYEDGFTGKPAQSDSAEYMRGFSLGKKQGERAHGGRNSKFVAKVK